MTRTKIIATLGPATEKPKIIKELIKAGMDMARLNMSHNTLDYHEMVIKNVRSAAKELKVKIPIIADLQGPKIRTGDLGEAGISVKTGDVVFLVDENAKIPVKSAQSFVPLQFPLYKYVKKGGAIFIEDGAIELEIKQVKNKMIEAVAMNDGAIKAKKGINAPGAKINISPLTKRDLVNLEFAVKALADYVALSFLSSDKDLKLLKKHIKKFQKKYNVKKDIKVIAKIEKMEALKNIKKIIKEADEVMVARGDLGMEMPIEELPLAQKSIIDECIRQKKPAIVATHMLKSMVKSPTPTRAEVLDIANAVIDGASTLMLSEETTVGKYPVRAVKLMDKIAGEIEAAERKKLIAKYHREFLA